MEERVEERGISTDILRILAVLILLLVIAAVFHANCQLTSLTVNNSEHYTDQEISEMTITEPTDRYAVLFWLRWNIKKGEGLPFIEKIEAKLTDKNSVVLTVYEKRVIGCVEVMGQYLYFDRDGLVVESSPTRLSDIPLITGLEFNDIVLHRTFSVQKQSMFETIMNLVKLIEIYKIKVGEIRFLYDDSVMLCCEDTIVRLGKHDTYDVSLASLGEILESLENRRVTLFMENYSENNRNVTAKPITEKKDIN